MRKEDNIFPSLLTGGRRNFYDAQTVEQTLSESPAFDCLLQVHIRGSQDTRIDGDQFSSPHALQLAILQKTQQLYLQGQGHLSDFIKQQRTAVSIFQFALHLPMRARKGPFFMAKELTLQQILWDRTTVDDDKRARLSTTVLMNRSRD